MALVSATTLFVALTGTASAETYSVGTSAQLEEAVKSANANCQANTIVLAGGTYVPPKTLSFTDTCGPQALEGPTHTPEALLDGGNEEVEHPEVLVVGEGVSLSMKDIVVQHGGSGASSAVEDLGSLVVEGVTLGGNRGAGLIVQPGATATVRNSTLSDGRSVALVNQGTATLLNATVAFNKLGGIENGGTLNLTNTIVAKNDSRNCVGLAAATNDHNLASDSTCGAELSGVDPLLSSYFNDLGATSMHSLRPGSPAIDAGDPAACPATDQRGLPRPDEAGKPCDMGADEYNATAPTINVPSDITKEATGPTGAVVTYSASPESSDDAIVSFSCTPKSGSTFPVGMTEVKCTAQDGHENTATKSFKVTIKPKDTTPPELQVPGTINASAESPAGAKVTYSVTATDPDNTAAELKISCSPESGSTFAIGETTVECTASDPAGNTSHASFKVIVKDTTAPELHVPSNITVPAESPSGAKVTYSATATDPDNATSELKVSCSPESGSTFPVGETTVECTASDPAGNTSHASFKVTVKPFELVFKEWLLKGSLTDHKLAQTLFTMPEHSTFNGHSTIPGELEANTSVPAFKSTVKLFGLLPITLGLTFTEAGPVKGTITSDPAHTGNELIKATAKDTIGVTSFTILGLTLATSCQTAEPVSFPLEASETLSQLETSGAKFNGETTLPAFHCTGAGGNVVALVLTMLVSGPQNPFTLSIEP
jgi:hypothetical protein